MLGFQWHEIRARRRPATRTGIFCAIVFASLLPADLAAQKLLDWPVRTGARPEAVAGGAGAVCWNPAATGWLDRRGEALVIDIRGPATAEVHGIAAATAVRVSDRVTLSVGYHHLGL